MMITLMRRNQKIALIALIFVTLLLLLWRRNGNDDDATSLCVPRRHFALLLGDSAVSVAMVTRLLESHNDVTLISPHVDLNASLIPHTTSSSEWLFLSQQQQSSFVSLRVANSLQLAIERNATLVCDELQRAVRAVSVRCQAQVTLINAVQNPLVAISEQITKLDEVDASARFALDRAVDRWLAQQVAIDWLHNCAGVAIARRLDMPVPVLLSEPRDQLQRFLFALWRSLRRAMARVQCGAGAARV
jgi:hypothetical protein